MVVDTTGNAHDCPGPRVTIPFRPKAATQTAEMRCLTTMSPVQIIAQCSEPSNEGEKLIASLPGMRIQTHTHPFDFLYMPETLRIETKHRSKPNVVPYCDWAARSLQFMSGNIASREFDWLLLTVRTKASGTFGFYHDSTCGTPL